MKKSVLIGLLCGQYVAILTAKMGCSRIHVFWGNYLKLFCCMWEHFPEIFGLPLWQNLFEKGMENLCGGFLVECVCR